MDHTPNVIGAYAIIFALICTLMTGCTTTYVTPAGQIMDGTRNPLYPPLEYEEWPALRGALP